MVKIRSISVFYLWCGGGTGWSFLLDHYIPHRTRALHQSTESVSREFTSRLVSRDFELDGGGSGGAMLVVVGPSIKMS